MLHFAGTRPVDLCRGEPARRAGHQQGAAIKLRRIRLTLAGPDTADTAARSSAPTAAGPIHAIACRVEQRPAGNETRWLMAPCTSGEIAAHTLVRQLLRRPAAPPPVKRASIGPTIAMTNTLRRGQGGNPGIEVPASLMMIKENSSRATSGASTQSPHAVPLPLPPGSEHPGGHSRCGDSGQASATGS